MTGGLYLCLATLCSKGNPDTVEEVFNKHICICWLFGHLYWSYAQVYSEVLNTCTCNSHCVRHLLFLETLVSLARLNTCFSSARVQSPLFHLHHRDIKRSTSVHTIMLQLNHFVTVSSQFSEWSNNSVSGKLLATDQVPLFHVIWALVVFSSSCQNRRYSHSHWQHLQKHLCFEVEKHCTM